MPEFGNMSVYHVDGMQSVVATVSGYDGLERYNLIRFITQVGANYVGAMTKATTHLVCKKFEGRKHNMAKRSGTNIVNHLWFEDSLKAGKCIPESPYATKSGQEVGPFTAKISHYSAASCREDLSKQKRIVFLDDSNICDIDAKSVLDINYLDVGCSTWSDSRLLKATQAKEIAPMIKNISTPKGRKLVKKYSNIFSSSSLSSADMECLSSQIALYDDISNLGPQNKNSSHHFKEHQNGRLEEVSIVADEIDNESSQEFDAANQMNNHLNFSFSHNSKKSCLKRHSRHESLIDVDHSDDSNLAMEDVGKMVQLYPDLVELSCVICWTDFSPTRGILPCGHRFCYACIQSWADQMALKGKTSTCPLCKAVFLSIKKVEDAEYCDQKIFSQTVPHSSTSENIVIDQDVEVSYDHLQHYSTTICYKCHNREPEDLLVSCHFCRRRMIHSFCLDPPISPWTCIGCKELRTLVQHFR